MISVVNSLCFALLALVAVFPSEETVRSFPSDELPSSLLGEGISESVRRPFLLHDSHPRMQILLSNSLSLFFYLYLLPYLILRRMAYLFGSLGSSANIQKVFCRSVPHAEFFLIYL